MSTIEPDLIDQLISGVEQVKDSNKPFTSKIAEMDRQVDVYTSRSLQRKARGVDLKPASVPEFRVESDRGLGGPSL